MRFFFLCTLFCTLVQPRGFSQQVYSRQTRERLIPIIIQAESSGNPNAVSRDGSRGLFQFTEPTWTWASEQAFGRALSFDDAFDPVKSRRVAEWFIDWLARQIDGHYSDALMIASYNWGIGNVKRNGYRIPDFLKNHPNKIYREILKGGAA